MSKEVTVEELREHLEEIIAEVEAGESVTIVRERTQAKRPGVAQEGKPFPFRGFDPGPRPKNLKSDPAELIIEERERERSGEKYGL
jgi:hypothetical protein